METNEVDPGQSFTGGQSWLSVTVFNRIMIIKSSVANFYYGNYVMKIDASNTGTINLSVESARDTLEREKTQLVSGLKHIENVLIRTSTMFKSEALILRNHYFLLGNLQSIVNKKDNETVVRLKNDHLKSAQGKNMLKSWLYGSRYENEKKAAAEHFGVKGGDLSAGEAIRILERKMNDKSNRLSLLQREVRRAKGKQTSLNEMKAGVEQKLRNLAASEKKSSDEKKAAETLRNDFSLLYQSNTGCEAINVMARFLYGQAKSVINLSSDKVIAEYKRIHVDDIFQKSNRAFIYTIRAGCTQLPQLVRKAAQAWYTPGGKTITTHCGQGMTQKGIGALISQFNRDRAQGSDTIYKAGQFFSTFREARVAQDIASKSQNAVKVVFDIKGNSGSTIAISDGLHFANREREIVYSPLAKFKVSAITQDRSGVYRIKLEETADENNARPLPY